MKVLWHSNSPMVKTGYGVQTRLFGDALTNDNHQVSVSCYWGHEGHILSVGNQTILPKGIDQWGNDILPFYHRKIKPDITIALMDIWVLHDQLFNDIPLITYLPIDHYPIPGRVKEKLQLPTAILAMSKFGYDAIDEWAKDNYLQDKVNLFYLPHAYNGTEFFPKNMKKERKKWGLNPDDFVITVVGANKGFPSRKSLDKIIRAFSVFSKYHPDAVLYLHTVHSGAPYAVDLLQLLSFYDVDSKRVNIADAPSLIVGDYDNDKMSSIYSASDVLLSPSMGEGFGIPVLEAQACGLPVITTGFSAQPEITFGGIVIPVDDEDLEITAQYSHQVRVPYTKIVTALEEAYERKGDKKWRKEAVAGAKDYEIKTVYNKHLKTILPELAELTSDKLFRNVGEQQ